MATTTVRQGCKAYWERRGRQWISHQKARTLLSGDMFRRVRDNSLVISVLDSEGDWHKIGCLHETDWYLEPASQIY